MFRASEKEKIPAGDNSWRADALLVLACAFIIVIFARSTEPGFRVLEHPDPKDSFYNLLVEGFQAGQLNLKMDPPPIMAKLANPYDPNNGAYLGDICDLTYYQGKLYMYFGVVPALVLLWPFATLTGHYLSDRAAVIIFFSAGLLVAAALLRDIWRRYFRRTSFWWCLSAVLAFGVVIGALIIVSLWCDVYEVAVTSAFAFTMMALACIWCALHEPKRSVLWLLLASFAYGLVVGSRPSSLFGAVILLVPAAMAWSSANPNSRRQCGFLVAAAVIPITLIGMGLMLYNQLRFGNPLEFGWHYQVQWKDDPRTATQFSLSYFWYNFRFYFLQPTRWTGHIPFLQFVPTFSFPPGYQFTGNSYGGLLGLSLIVWLAPGVLLLWKNRFKDEMIVLRWFVVAIFLLFVSCASILCFFSSTIVRYEMDFLPALVLLGIIGIFSLQYAMESPLQRRVVSYGCGVLLAGSILLNVFASLEAHAEARYFDGNSLVRAGRTATAIDYFHNALAIEPQSANFHAALGTAYYQEQQPASAIVQFEKAFEISSNFPDAGVARNNLAYSLLKTGQISDAIVQFRKVLEDQPDFAEAHNALGDCLFQSGKLDDAIAEYQKAVEIKPDLADAQNNLGYCLSQVGRPTEAIVHFQKLLELKPDDAYVHNNLGSCLLQAGKVDDAIVQFQQALKLQPQFAHAYSNLGAAFSRKGMTTQAKDAYQKAAQFK